MHNYFFKQVLLTDGWHENIRATIDHTGLFSELIKQPQADKADTLLDCVIPCMPNCHSHVFQRTMAGLTEYKTADTDSFWSWRELMYRYANQISAQQLYHIACYTYYEMLQAGYNAVCEFHYIHRDLQDHKNTTNMSLAILRAAHDVGIQLTFLPVLYSQAHIDGSPLSKQQQRFKLSTQEYIDLYHRLEKNLYPEQNIGICFHSLRAVSIQQMQQVLKQLDHGQAIHIHIAEQQAEIEQVQQQTNFRPVEWLYQNFEVNHNWCLIHATHLTAKEIQLISQSNAIVGLCPLTEANLGDGIFPLQQFLQQDGRFAIGSDSHILINPMQEMQMLEYSQRLHCQQRIIASSKSSPNVGTLLWNQAVKNGASCTQLPIAGMQKGQTANWISLDTRHPLLTSLDGKSRLDSCIFAHNAIHTETYLHGQKLVPMPYEIRQNYKNTLKALR